jgi:hypothetical protein
LEAREKYLEYAKKDQKKVTRLLRCDPEPFKISRLGNAI